MRRAIAQDSARTMQDIELAYAADGLNMKGRLYLPDGAAPVAGVLVFPEAFGLGEHAKSRARRLAELGYAALAADLHGDATLIEDLGAVMPKINDLRANPEHTRARAGGALAALASRPEIGSKPIAAIGYCFGGTMALELARGGADIKAVAGFHSGLATTRPEDASAIKARILVCIGADDPGIPAEQRAAFEDEMRAGKVNWRMDLYGGVVHSFTNEHADRLGRPEFARYDAEADRLSWAAMVDLFKQTLH
jgi:dienelactone hydrolase